ncbi:acetyl-CoA carboxylase biotin carboxylase subunit [Desulfarculus baarsii]
MFKKVLIANRGEIAVRVMRSCREMGLGTVAVYSDVDAHALHVLEADEAVCLGQAEPSASYLNIAKIIEAAKQTGAEAIHPGYGFLAENAHFATACAKAGLVFIGPSPRVIEELGSKTRARQIMEKAGVPLIPGMLEPTMDADVLLAEAQRMGYPVLIKAVAGGGGKGMRMVAKAEEMREACASACGEAQKAFGDGNVYLEKNLIQPRHVEIQILADSHGNVVHLFERECSIQRRHQKIVEETPSVALTPETRQAMGRAAVAAAKAAGYVGAGTVEFLLDHDGRSFYFLEVNTRLQVEHPITELTTGVDLVRLQVEIAAGAALPFGQEDLAQRGHAIECRVYAEDPEADFFPSPGRLLVHREPKGPGVRNDCGVYEGFEVPMDYDPILAKLVTHGRTREEARQRMIRALQNYVVLGVKTSIGFLTDVLASEPFIAGQTYTDFIPRHFAGWRQSADDLELAALAYAAGESSQTNVASGPGKAAGWPTPWQTLGGWRL